MENSKFTTKYQQNNPANLMTKYLEMAKIKKHSETIGLHPYIGNGSINMISRGSLRPRGSYTSRPRGTTPQPRQRIPAHIEVNEDHIQVSLLRLKSMTTRNFHWYDYSTLLKRQQYMMSTTTRTMRTMTTRIMTSRVTSTNYCSTSDNS
eukprot:3282329-Amphidinium_carterae.3